MHGSFNTGILWEFKTLFVNQTLKIIFTPQSKSTVTKSRVSSRKLKLENLNFNRVKI